MTQQDLVVLLGAGASVDAGLPTSVGLTQRIYEEVAGNQLNASAYGKLIGYLISKLQLRNTKKGLSPYTPIDVEDLFEALAALVDRDRFVISEFVERWDGALDSLASPDIDAIGKHLANIFARFSQNASRNRGRVDTFGTSRDVQSLVRALRSPARFKGGRWGPDEFLRPFITALIGNLSADPERVDYLKPMVTSTFVGSIATLNYDLVLEASCGRSGVVFDYGLDRWAQQRRVSWRAPRELRIIKLHGSINWIGTPDEFEVNPEQAHPYSARAIIFGGSEQKLSAAGPFLQFLNSFERSILRSGTLLIVGYSFRDKHINTILNRWRLTRRRSKVIVIDPQLTHRQLAFLQPGKMKRKVGGKEVFHELEVDLLPLGAAEGIAEFFAQPDLFRDGLSHPKAVPIGRSISP